MVNPTAYPEVNLVLNELHASAKSALGGQFVGMLLFGSLTTGAFDEASDVDVLFVTGGPVSSETFEALKSMHARVAEMDIWWATQLEVSYVPQKALRRFDPNDKLYPRLDRGRGEPLHWMSHESDWVVQRHLARENGIAIEGPSPKDLIDPVSPDELRGAMRPLLKDWLPYLTAEPVTHNGYQSYIVLTVCRVLYTIQLGEVATKPQATAWAMQTLDPRWTPLIERALVGRLNAGMPVDPIELDLTMQFLHYGIDYSEKISNPTPYPEINLVLNELLTGAKFALGDQFVGMYLYGSLSSGDFNLDTSDVDFLFVTEGELPQEQIAALEGLHQRLWASGLKWAAKLEGAYVPRQLIRRHDLSAPPCPTVNEHAFYVARLGSDWIIQRHILRDGVVVEGPSPKSLIDPITGDEVRAAVVQLMKEWWEPMLKNPAWLDERGPEYKVYAVVSMCRVLYTLEYKAIASKPVSARWALTQVNEAQRRQIEDALAWNYGLEWKHTLDEALELIQYALEYETKMTRPTSQATRNAQS